MVTSIKPVHNGKPSGSSDTPRHSDSSHHSHPADHENHSVSKRAPKSSETKKSETSRKTPEPPKSSSSPKSDHDDHSEIAALREASRSLAGKSDKESGSPKPVDAPYVTKVVVGAVKDGAYNGKHHQDVAKLDSRLDDLNKRREEVKKKIEDHKPSGFIGFFTAPFASTGNAVAETKLRVIDAQIKHIEEKKENAVAFDSYAQILRATGADDATVKTLDNTNFSVVEKEALSIKGADAVFAPDENKISVSEEIPEAISKLRSDPSIAKFFDADTNKITDAKGLVKELVKQNALPTVLAGAELLLHESGHQKDYESGADVWNDAVIANKVEKAKSEPGLGDGFEKLGVLANRAAREEIRASRIDDRKEGVVHEVVKAKEVKQVRFGEQLRVRYGYVPKDGYMAFAMIDKTTGVEVEASKQRRAFKKDPSKFELRPLSDDKVAENYIRLMGEGFVEQAKDNVYEAYDSDNVKASAEQWKERRADTVGGVTLDSLDDGGRSRSGGGLDDGGRSRSGAFLDDGGRSRSGGGLDDGGRSRSGAFLDDGGRSRSGGGLDDGGRSRSGGGLNDE